VVVVKALSFRGSQSTSKCTRAGLSSHPFSPDLRKSGQIGGLPTHNVLKQL